MKFASKGDALSLLHARANVRGMFKSTTDKVTTVSGHRLFTFGLFIILPGVRPALSAVIEVDLGLHLFALRSNLLQQLV